MTSLPRSAQDIADRLLARDPLPPLVPTQVFDAALTQEITALPASACGQDRPASAQR